MWPTKLIVVFLSLTSACGLVIGEKIEDNSDLKLNKVFILHRHGDRTPVQTYPRDPYGQEKYWPDGWGMLLVSGKRRLYNLGKLLRQRYRQDLNFLTDNPLEVEVKSSGELRCLASVECILTSLYPPQGRLVIEPDLKWQPFPVVMQPKAHDLMLNPISNCSAAEAEEQLIWNSEAVRSYMQSKKHVFDVLNTFSGQNVESLLDAFLIYDTMHIERLNNMTLPEWVTESLFNEMADIADKFFYFSGSTRRIQRLRTGVFLNDLRNNLLDPNSGNSIPILYRNSSDSFFSFRQRKEISKPKSSITRLQSLYRDADSIKKFAKKIFFYSTHDGQVANVLQSLGAVDRETMKSPPYGASIIFEQWINRTTNDALIKIFYLNDTEKGLLHSIPVPGCSPHDQSCPVNRFLQAIDLWIVKNGQRECSTRRTQILPDHNYNDFTISSHVPHRGDKDMSIVYKFPSSRPWYSRFNRTMEIIV